MGLDSGFDKGLTPLRNHLAKADEARESFGRTDLYSTGAKGLDEYLGAGFGRKNNGYEMVLIYSEPGKGKSLLGLNMMLDPIFKGVNTGLMILEDDPADVVNRLRVMTDNKIDNCTNVFFANDQSNGYTLDEAMDAIDKWFLICDVILLDHLEYLFVGAVGESERSQFQKQELWMRHLNSLMKKNGKTIVMIQHTNKSGNDGILKVKGSSAFVQTCTKVINIDRGKDANSMVISLEKTRFTPHRYHKYTVGIDKFKLKDLA